MLEKIIALIMSIVTLGLTDISVTPKTEEPVKPCDEMFITINGKQYVRTLADDFDGTELNTSNWELCPEWKRQDLECYWRNDAVSLSGDGYLKITTSLEDDACYTGGIRSKGLFEQKYGYFEIRCQLNQVPGYWTAFWLMGETVGNVGNRGEDGTEIDIMESAYHDINQINSALHWDGYGEYHESSGKNSIIDGIYEGFHTFSLLWTEDEYVFYVDGEETWRTTDGGVCKVPLYLKITAETGSWTGMPKKWNMPDSFIIDYVRVYRENK